MNYFEQIEAMHQQVREYVEKMEPDYKVTEIDASFTTKYVPPIHALGEQPEYVFLDSKARFKVYAFYKARRHHLSCDVWVLPNGILHMGDRSVSI